MLGFLEKMLCDIINIYIYIYINIVTNTHIFPIQKKEKHYHKKGWDLKS
jgi:hypothetical protein